MMLSDDLDEIDWEFMGGNVTHAETNFFGKGIQNYHNAYLPPRRQRCAGRLPQLYHRLDQGWYGLLHRYSKGPQPAPSGCRQLPSDPHAIVARHLGRWRSQARRGVRDWAGGTTDYSKGPYTMYVKTVQVTDFSSGKEYSYGDQTGSWQSIQIKQ